MIQSLHVPKLKAGMITDRTAQAATWGLLSVLVLVTIAGGLVDIYRLFTARNWAYAVAQEAALTGVSRGRDWDAVSNDGLIQLNSTVAESEARNVITSAMRMRGISNYFTDVRVLPDPFGGTISGFPLRPVRLGETLGNWSSDEPAVGVYLEVPMDWTLLDVFGIVPKEIRVFASAGVVQ
jgi:hypothetical protein